MPAWQAEGNCAACFSSVDYVELSTLDASAVYVNPYGCALGADGEVTHRRPKRTLKLGCADMNDCPSDQEAFWRDPLRYACGETTDARTRRRAPQALRARLRLRLRLRLRPLRGLLLPPARQAGRPLRILRYLVYDFCK